ncbi:MAG: hypothetical protein WA964_19830 [Ilumatobacter sp.]|uniref:hypothetical protein n=1 Tax=Ilumatobacter sp. TaxID=1967498 RepID=UPI003C77084A
MRIFRTSSTARRFGVTLSAVLALGAVGVGGYNMASAQTVAEERPVFIPINPCRLIDTRAGDANVGPLARPLASETVAVTAHGSNGQCVGASAIPSTAVGLSMNVTAIRATEPGTFVTFWGSGPNPGVSNLNPSPGQPPTPNSVNTPLSDTGTFNMANAFGTVEILIDVNGYYADHDHDDRYYTEAESDARFQTQAETDGRYRTRAELDARFAQLDDLPFLAGGTVLDDGTSTANEVSGFAGPPGVTASVSESSVEEGQYSLTISNTGGLTNPIIQITGVADDSGANSGATACSLSSAPPETLSDTFTFVVGCFGEDDNNAGAIVAEDISFSFVVIG